VRGISDFSLFFPLQPNPVAITFQLNLMPLPGWGEGDHVMFPFRERGTEWRHCVPVWACWSCSVAWTDETLALPGRTEMKTTIMRLRFVERGLV
jgi:hypothetical protein